MSSYEHYDTTSSHYDRTRWPIGLEIITGCLAQAGVSLGEMRLLDAGCGTGNYSAALLDQVKEIEAVDLSTGMLAAARAKLGDAAAAGRIAFHQAPIEALPLADASVDGAMINQVLHHLPNDPAAGWPQHLKALAELARVLRPGGVLVLNTCSHTQVREGYWPFHLIPEARDAIIDRLMPLAAIETALDSLGLDCRGRFVPVDAVIQGQDYFDPRGPLSAEWRAGDSTWALVDAEGLRTVERTLGNLDRAGRLADHLAEHDARRPDIGQITLLYAVKR
jgi:ubiquinone/menaquinone biosynthesis C-methylase UbiE